MAMTRTQIKTTALKGVRPEECLLEVNRFLFREEVGGLFSTCFYGILNTRTGQLSYCSAGHNPPYVLRASGDVESVPEVGGCPLGLFGEMGYTGSCAQIDPGDALFLYTDGVPEANNAAEEESTYDRLVSSLGESTSLACRDMIDRLTRDLLAFTAGAPQSDDITMVCIRRRQ